MMTRLSMILANCGKKLLHADMQIYFKNRQSHSDTSIICILGKFLLKLHSRLVQGDSQIWWDLGVQIHTVANFYPCSPTISFFTWNSLTSITTPRNKEITIQIKIKTTKNHPLQHLKWPLKGGTEASKEKHRSILPLYITSFPRRFKRKNTSSIVQFNLDYKNTASIKKKHFAGN